MANTNSVRTFTSQSQTVVADFCVNGFVSGANDPSMMGFQGFFSSVARLPVGPVTKPPVATIAPPAAAGVCGAPVSQPNATNNRIVNGAVVPNGGHPWACALVQKGPFQFCDCTVVRPVRIMQRASELKPFFRSFLLD